MYHHLQDVVNGIKMRRWPSEVSHKTFISVALGILICVDYFVFFKCTLLSPVGF